MGKYDNKDKLLLSDWLLLCGTGLLIKSGIDKAKEQKKEEEIEYENYIEDLRKNEKIQNIRNRINSIRESVTCDFKKGISLDEFTDIAKKIANRIKRITKVEIHNGIVYCSVISQTGVSEWEFNVDFNNWGNVTGTRWTYTENFDSSIPENYGDRVANEIKELLLKKGIVLKDLSNEVDVNKILGEDNSLCYYEKQSFWNKVFKNTNSIILDYKYEELIGEHIYPVFAIFQNRGFKNIKTFKIYDLNSKNIYLRNKVNKIIVNGLELKDCNREIDKNAEILITIHEKKKIKIDFNTKNYKKMEHNSVEKQLKDMGFIDINKEKIPDILIGWLKKENNVEEIFIDNEPIDLNKDYYFDAKIIIKYHINKF